MNGGVVLRCVLVDLVADHREIDVKNGLNGLARRLSAVLHTDHQNAPARVGHRDDVLDVLDVAGELLVLCSGDYVLREGQLVVLDPRNGAESWNLPLGDFPGAMALDGRDLWLAAWGQYDLQPGGTQEGHVTRVSLDQRAFDRGPENPWRVQAGATDLCLAGGRLFVSCYAQDALCVIQGDSLLECLPVGHGPGALLLLE